MGKLENDFHKEMLGIYKTAFNELGIRLTAFLKMVNSNGGVKAAKLLINSTKVSSGYLKLFENQRLDLTVEALVAEHEKWHELFTPNDIKNAKKRLSEYKK